MEALASIVAAIGLPSIRERHTLLSPRSMSSHDFALPSAEPASNVLRFEFAATEPDFQNEASGPKNGSFSV